MRTILMFIHIMASMGLISLVLLQHGRGADAGAAFGSGASQTLFGARGSSNFLTRTTAILAAIFFTTSLLLAYVTGQMHQRQSVTEKLSMPSVPVSQIPGPQDLPTVPSAPAEKVADSVPSSPPTTANETTPAAPAPVTSPSNPDAPNVVIPNPPAESSPNKAEDLPMIQDSNPSSAGEKIRE